MDTELLMRFIPLLYVGWLGLENVALSLKVVLAEISAEQRPTL